MRALVVVIALAGVARADELADAKQAHDRGDWPAAIRALRTFVEAHPADPEAVTAGELWVDAMTHTGAMPDDYERALATLAGVPGFAAPEPHTWMLRVRRHIAAGKAQIANEAEHPDLAAEEYMRLAEDPAQENRDEAYYNAGVLFEEAHDLERARQMYESVAKIRTSALAHKALFRLASALRFVDPARSAEVLARVSAQPCSWPCVDLSQEARMTAGELYWYLGETAKATAMLEAYLAAGHSSPLDREIVVEQVALIYEESGQLVRAERAFERYFRVVVHPQSRISIHRANTQLALGKRAAAERSYDLAISLAEQSSREDPAQLAAALYEKAQFLARDAVKAPPNQRVARVMAAVHAYDDVVTARSATWSVAALDRQGHLLEEYQHTLVVLESNNLLQADPAQQSYVEAANLARDAHVSTSEALDAQDALARIDGSYPPRPEHHAAFIASAPIVVAGP